MSLESDGVFVTKLTPLTVRSNLPLVFKTGSKVYIMLVRSTPNLPLQQIAKLLKPYLKNQIGFKLYKQERIVSKYIRQLISNFTYLQKFRLNPKYDWAALKRFQIVLEDRTPFFEYLVKFPPLNKYWQQYGNANILEDRKSIIVIAHDTSQIPSLYTIKFILSLYYRAIKGEPIADYIFLLLISNKMKWVILKTEAETEEDKTIRAIRVLLRLINKYLKQDDVSNIEEMIHKETDEDLQEEPITIKHIDTETPVSTDKEEKVELPGKTVKTVKNVIVPKEKQQTETEEQEKIVTLARTIISDKKNKNRLINKAISNRPTELKKEIKNYISHKLSKYIPSTATKIIKPDIQKELERKKTEAVLNDVLVQRPTKKPVLEYHTKYASTSKIAKNILNDFFPKPTTDILDFNHNTWHGAVDLLTLLLVNLANSFNMKVIFKGKEPYIKKNLNNIILNGIEVFYTLIDGDREFNFSFILPSIDNGILNVFGQEYSILPQLLPNAIQSNKLGIVRIHALHDLITITRKSKYVEMKIAGTLMTPPIAFCLMRSWKEFSDRYHINYNLQENPAKDKISIKLKENLYLVINNYNELDEIAKTNLASIFASTKIDKIYDKFDEEPLTKEWFIRLVNIINTSYYDIFLTRLNGFLDYITINNLRQLGYPDNLPDLIMLINDTLIISPESFMKAENDLTGYRLRTYEQVIHLAYNIFFEELLVYLKNKLIYNFIRKINIDKFSVINRLITGNPCIMTIENSNPLEFYALLNRITYKGYNGISEEAVSLNLRNIHSTYKGSIDIIDTPEGKNIGVVQTATNALTVITKTGLLGIYDQNSVLKAGMFSPTISLIPFARQNEPTRLLISASQLKQAVLVNDNQPPAIMSGYEFILPSVLYNKFIKRSPCDGIVKEVTEKTIEIEGDLETKIVPFENFSGKSGIGINTFIDLKPIVKKGDKVKEGQPLVSSKYFFNGEVYSYGTNVLAGLMNYYGYTYEDGIVVSSKLVDRLTSTHTTVYKFYITEEDMLYKVYKLKGEPVEAGDYLISASGKKLQDYIESTIFNAEVLLTPEGFKGVSQYKGVIEDLKIFTNNIENIDINERERLKPFIFISEEPVYYKSKVLKGVYIEISIKHQARLTIGDKLVTRHANKGVISLIEEETQMPLLKDGRRLDIIFSPQAIVNRLVTGLLYEMQLSKLSYFFGSQLLKEKGNFEKIINLLKVLEEFDKGKEKEYQRAFLVEIEFNKKLQHFIYEIVKKTGLFPIVIPPFYEPSLQQLSKVSHLLNIPFKEEITLKDKTKIQIPTGFVYLLKLEHMAGIKIGGRSIGGYDVKTGQPFSGYRKGGGIKFGEYDTMNLIAWDVDNLLTEMHLSNIALKKKLYADIIDKGYASLSNYATETTIRKDRDIIANTLEIYFKSIMIEP